MARDSFIAFLLVTFTVVCSTASPRNLRDWAAYCDSAKCQPPLCRCSSIGIPGGLHYNSTPQFVLLTFDDGINVGNYGYYQRIFRNRTNRDGCPAAGTFFLSHEYTDYTMVHTIYRQGHEIALHSITHNVSTDYWRDINVTQLRQEFGGERTLVSAFASIPDAAMQGIRLPFLQMSGDNSFEMLAKENLSYDCSWPTRHTSPGMWPYTLEYASTQDCVIGPCPQQSWKNVWVIPMLSWIDGRKEICAMVDACLEIPETVDGLVNFMIENFNRTYLTNKAPFGFYVHAAWFNVDPIHFPAYTKFVDYLQSLPDVYLVGGTTVIDWVKNPKPLVEMSNSTWSNCRKPSPPACNPKTCKLKRGDEERYMTICSGSCPSVYPSGGSKISSRGGFSQNFCPYYVTNVLLP